jgi:acyl-CoA thioesterase
MALLASIVFNVRWIIIGTCRKLILYCPENYGIFATLQMTERKMLKLEAKDFSELIGLIIHRPHDGTCVSEIELDQRHLSLAARVHGGVLASMLDTTLGGAVFAGIPKGRGCATLSLNVNFFRPVMAGKLVCRARLANLSRQTAHASGEIHDEKGRLIASATATFFVTPTVEQPPKNFAP